MRAAIYAKRGPAAEVLRLVELPQPSPDAGEVRVKIAYSGVNPSDVKSRGGVANPVMDFAYVVPHSDGAGVVDAVGAGVPDEWLGRRVWTFNAQWGRAHGTAAEWVALPLAQVVPLPDGVPIETGAAIGIPLMTAYHAIASCGSLLGRSVLVMGAAGAVGHYATQLARLAGARVIGVVSSAQKAALAREAGAHEVANYRDEDLAARVREITGGKGVDVIVEVDAAANAGRYGELLAFGGKVVVYGSGQPHIALPFRPMITGFVQLYFFIVYKLPDAVLRETIDGVSALLGRSALTHQPLAFFALDEIAAAHERVEQGANAKVLIRLTEITEA